MDQRLPWPKSMIGLLLTAVFFNNVIRKRVTGER